MGFIEVNNVVFCDNPDCEKVYMWDGKPEGGDIRAKTVLPCGHEIVNALLSGDCIRDNHKATKMLEYINRNKLIKWRAYDMIKKKGGRFDDAINIDVPTEDLTNEEQMKLFR